MKKTEAKEIRKKEREGEERRVLPRLLIRLRLPLASLVCLGDGAMSAADDLTQKIRGSIPLSESMQFSIDSLSQEAIRVVAPLQPNVNIHGTGFAGSIYSLGVLTGWALGTHIMDELAMDGDLVVGKAEISYRAPVKADLECHCQATTEQRESFLQQFREEGKSRLALEVTIGELPQAILKATFVALARSQST
jgi:thioesterase domain-containing protein